MNTQQISGCQEQEERGNEELLVNRMRFIVGLMEILSNQTLVMVVHLCDYTKKHYDFQFKCENYDAWYV